MLGTVYFAISETEIQPELFSTAVVATASVASIAVVSAGLLVHFKNLKH
jgi:hypothetical protein